LLKVIAAISFGRADPDAMSQAIRATRVVVLPEPAGATPRSVRARGRSGSLVRGKSGETLGNRRME